ncbi:vWA domain-containing protein [Clostridium paraputrificum]|uniref:vWA domain-containing protein n=1 Tax=Clostridium TaxID=1485 RepID=UPI003D33BF4D
MNAKKINLKYVGIIAVTALLIFGVVYGGISLTKNLGKNKDVVVAEDALGELDKIYKKININDVDPIKGSVDLTSTSLKDTLPDIDKYPAQVENTTDNFIEIFASVEKTGEGKDGWLVDVARDFNKAGIKVNGKDVSIKIRGLASGMGMDYIVSKKHIADGYTPSNELWGEMMKAKGTDVTLLDKRMVGNVSGILISKSKQDELVKKYGSINLKNITDAVASNEIAMGYTNPLSSATGLNFLVSTLSTLDGKDILSSTAAEGFEKFQTNIPLVAYTTLQMRASAEAGGLDGFIMEYQTYINSPELKSNYVFTPFGVRHDSPLYSIGNLSEEKKAIMDKFIEFYKGDTYQKKASDYGFNNNEDYKSEINLAEGQNIIQAQKLWKEKKNASKRISAVFVADISGSMQGNPLNKLKKSLLNGSQYIGSDNSIGLVTYSDDVNINLPIGKFDINQRALFTGAVNNMESGGGTATFDGVSVAIRMLMDEKAKDPDTKLMLFVLSDGETNRGHSLNDIEGILRALKIPVHTVGYNADIDVLKNISSINEAASINADSDDVVYTLGSLFNAEM